MAAVDAKFVWLETLRNARKTSLVQDGKWRIVVHTLKGICCGLKFVMKGHSTREEKPLLCNLV